MNLKRRLRDWGFTRVGLKEAEKAVEVWEREAIGSESEGGRRTRRVCVCELGE